jgi:5-methylcytosine-specific restriction endonuclease McrA
MDHIIPVSLGGHPSDPDNLQLAHRCCNREKSNKMQAPIEIEEESTIDNRDLPLSLDWTTYKSAT